MSLPETLSTTCLAADSHRRTRINLPASNVRLLCYDELDVVRIEQTDLLHSLNTSILFEYLGAGSGSIAIAFSNTRERETLVRSPGRVGRNAGRQGSVGTERIRTIQPRFYIETRDRARRFAHARSRTPLCNRRLD